MRFFDLHCDTLSFFGKNKKYSLYENNGHIDLRRLCQGRVAAQCFAIFLPQSDNITDTSSYNFKLLKRMYKSFILSMKQYPGLIRQAVNADDIRKNIKDNKISAILTVENGDFVGNDLNRLNVCKSMGVRIMSLTWNYENSLGYPCAAGVRHAQPLKAMGLLAIEMLNNLDIIIDVSHLSEGGFWDVMKKSRKPFIATHSCCSEVLPHPRNLSDEQLRAIGNCGGVVGINFYTPFLKAEPSATFISDIVRQAQHIKNTAGIDAVALGSDFDGMNSLLEFRDCSGLPLIAEGLNREFTADETEKICFSNALRVLDS